MGDWYLKSNANKHKKNNYNNFMVIKWHPPDQNYVKLNFDGSVAKDKVAPGLLSETTLGILLVVEL